MKNLLLSLTLLLAFQLSVSAQTTVSLTINHKLGNNSFSMGTSVQNNLGDNFSVSRLEYYISQITLTHDGGQETLISDTYVLANAQWTTTIGLGSRDITNLEKISFYVGVDQANNHKDPSLWPSEHPLAPKNPSMHWGWASGYRFLAYEGSCGSSLAQVFELHGLGDNNYFKTEVDLSASAANGELAIELDADYTRGLEGIDLSSDVIVHGEDSEARVALQNFRDFVFGPASPNTSIDDNLQLGSFDVYPNPSSNGSINLRLSQNQSVALDLVVTDLSGREISHKQVSGTSIDTSFEIAQPGMYLVAIMKDGQQIAVKKAVIQ